MQTLVSVNRETFSESRMRKACLSGSMTEAETGGQSGASPGLSVHRDHRLSNKRTTIGRATPPVLRCARFWSES
jgi:hypothetical protein